eukprot:1774136-Rhodomonas_salina.2
MQQHNTSSKQRQTASAVHKQRSLTRKRKRQSGLHVLQERGVPCRRVQRVLAVRRRREEKSKQTNGGENPNTERQRTDVRFPLPAHGPCARSGIEPPDGVLEAKEDGAGEAARVLDRNCDHVRGVCDGEPFFQTPCLRQTRDTDLAVADAAWRCALRCLLSTQLGVVHGMSMVVLN